MEPSFLLLSETGLRAERDWIPILIPVILVLALLSLILIASVPARAAQSNDSGAYIDGVRFIQYLDDNVALEELKSGNLDTYYFRIPRISTKYFVDTLSREYYFNMILFGQRHCGIYW